MNAETNSEMYDLMAEASAAFLGKQIPAPEPEEYPGDVAFEKVVNLLLTDLPTALGRLVGSLLWDVVSYSDFCGWPTTDDVLMFKEGMADAVASAMKSEPRAGFPAREEVIAKFSDLVAKIHAIAADHADW